MKNSYLFSFLMLCMPALFGAASSSTDQPEQTHAALQDDEPATQSMVELEELYQAAQQAQPASTSGSAALPDDQTRKRTKRAAALQAFGKPAAKRPRTQTASRTPEEYRQQFIDAISQNNVPEIIEAYDQFARSGGNTEELQNMPEFIEYLNGKPISVYLHQLSLKYLHSANEEIIAPFKKLLLMSPTTTRIHTNIQDFLGKRLIIKSQNDKLTLMSIPLAIKYSDLLREMYTHQLPLNPHEASTNTLLNAPLPLEEPEMLDLSNFSERTLRSLIYMMEYINKAGRLPKGTKFVNFPNIDLLKEIYELAEFLRVTKPIKDLLARSAIITVNSAYKGNFKVLDQLDPSAQQSIATYSILSTQNPQNWSESEWRKSKPFTISIADLISSHRIPPVDRLGYLMLTMLHITDLTGLANIPGIQNARYIDLHMNSLKTIKAGDFSSLPNVGRLSLRDNKIVRVDLLGFDGINNLVSIDLMDNQISSFIPGTFANLHNLSELLLSGNPIGTNREERARLEEEVRIATNGQGRIEW